MRVEVANRHRKYAIDEKEVRRLARGVSRCEKVDLRFISIVAVGHSWMRKLNRQFLNRDKTTDVLAFPLGGDCELEGEIYINLDQANRQAKDYGVSLTNEVTRLVIHGLLHLIGYRDMKSSERRLMEARQEELVEYLDRGRAVRP